MGLSALLTLPLANTVKRLYYNCVNAIDFSIYQQGLWEIASLRSWNPYLTLHDLYFFNDHFTPAILIALPFIWISGFSPYSLLFVEWLFYLAGLALVLYLLRPKLSHALWIAAFYVFTKGLLVGLIFPVHPDTWSIPFWLGLIWSVQRKDLRAIILFGIGASLFKEYFCFAIIGLSAYYLLARNFRFFWPLFLWGTGYAVFCFYIRPVILGDIFAYSKMAAKGVEKGLFHYLLWRIKNFNYPTALKIYYPFVLPTIWIIKKEVKSFDHFIFPTLMALAPLFGMHFLTDKIYGQYAPALTAIPLGLVLFSSFIPENAQRYKIILPALALFALSALSNYKNMVVFLATGQSKKCTAASGQKAKLAEVSKIVHELPPETRLYSTGGVIPHLYRPGLKIFQVGGLHEIIYSVETVDKHWVYDYVLLEKNTHGDIYPIPQDKLPLIEAQCRLSAKEVLLDNEFYFMAKGEFRKQCGVSWEEVP